MSEKQAKRRRRVSEGAVLPVDKRLKAALTELREYVDNYNRAPAIALRAGGIFRQLDTRLFQWTKHDGQLFGYRVQEIEDGLFERHVWYVNPGIRLSEMTAEERAPITTAIFKACLDQGAGPVGFYSPSHDSQIISQKFQPIFLFEKSPGVVTPGRTIN